MVGADIVRLLALARKLEALDKDPARELGYLNGVLLTLLYLNGDTNDPPISEEDLQ